MARIGTRAISRTQQRPISFGNKPLRFFNPKCFCFKLHFQLTLPLQVQGPSCYFCCLLLQKFKTHRNPVRSPLELTFLSPRGSHKKISHNFRFHNPKSTTQERARKPRFCARKPRFCARTRKNAQDFFWATKPAIFCFLRSTCEFVSIATPFFWNPTSRPRPPFYYMELPHQLNWAILTHHS